MSVDPLINIHIDFTDSLNSPEFATILTSIRTQSIQVIRIRVDIKIVSTFLKFRFGLEQSLRERETHRVAANPTIP